MAGGATALSLTTNVNWLTRVDRTAPFSKSAALRIARREWRAWTVDPPRRHGAERQNQVDRIVLFGESLALVRDAPGAGEKKDVLNVHEPSHLCRLRRSCRTRRLRPAAASRPGVHAPVPKPLDAKTQLENHM